MLARRQKHHRLPGTIKFYPVINSRPGIPQNPVTLSTYDKIIGLDDITDENYNGTLLNMISPDQLIVLTIHVEVEKISKQQQPFIQFLEQARKRIFIGYRLGRCWINTRILSPVKLKIGLSGAGKAPFAGKYCSQCLSVNS